MTISRGSNGLTLGRKRPSSQGHAIHRDPPRDTHFRPLPKTPGKEPFRLDLKDILSKDDYDAIVNRGCLVFHLNVHMDGISYAVPQELVAAGMEADLSKPGHAGALPDFLLHRGLRLLQRRSRPVLTAVLRALRALPSSLVRRARKTRWGKPRRWHEHDTRWFHAQLLRRQTWHEDAGVAEFEQIETSV